MGISKAEQVNKRITKQNIQCSRGRCGDPMRLTECSDTVTNLLWIYNKSVFDKGHDESVNENRGENLPVHGWGRVASLWPSRSNLYRADGKFYHQLRCPFHVGSVSLCRYDNRRHADDIEEKFDVLSLFNIPHPRPIDWSFLSRLRARSVVKCRLLGKLKDGRNSLEYRVVFG